MQQILGDVDHFLRVQEIVLLDLVVIRNAVGQTQRVAMLDYQNQVQFVLQNQFDLHQLRLVCKVLKKTEVLLGTAVPADCPPLPLNKSSANLFENPDDEESVVFGVIGVEDVARLVFLDQRHQGDLGVIGLHGAVFVEHLGDLERSLEKGGVVQLIADLGRVLLVIPTLIGYLFSLFVAKEIGSE